MIEKIRVFIERQNKQLEKEVRKYFVLYRMFLYFILHLPFYFIAVPIVAVIRMIRPWFLVRFSVLYTLAIGHLAANTELYLCEKDDKVNIPKGRRYIDLFYPTWTPVCNKYLLLMWKKLLCVFPEFVLSPIKKINRCLPGWEIHMIGNNTSHDRDTRNLFMQYPAHLRFTIEEEERGTIELKKLGIPEGKPFVCLLVRDDVYKEEKKHAVYSNYICSDVESEFRNSDIDNYILAIEELIKRGYYIVRMGVVVNKPLKIDHPQVIDYAWKGLRSEFMDIYLGAKCDFCVSTGSGWDAIPYIFRRPIVYTNFVPFCYAFTFEKNSIFISKRIRDFKKNRDLSFKEIFDRKIGFLERSSDYTDRGVSLIENTPEEILGVVVEMVERLNDTWKETEEDRDLQKNFWEIFPTKALSRWGTLHGKIYSKLGANYLRAHKELLE